MGALGGGSIGGWEHWGWEHGGVGGSMVCGWEHGVWVGAWGVWVGAWGVWVGAWGVGGVGVVGATPLCMHHKSSSPEQLLFIESNLSSCKQSVTSSGTIGNINLDV